MPLIRIIFGAAIVSPMWGIVSTQLFLQSWLAFINAVTNLIGTVRGKVGRKQCLLGAGVCLAQMLLYTGLLYLGGYLLTDVFSFGWTMVENAVYWVFWVFAVLAFLYMVRQFPLQVRRVWRFANVPGALEADILERRLRELGDAKRQ